jgi:hypothetical protein
MYVGFSGGDANIAALIGYARAHNAAVSGLSYYTDTMTGGWRAVHGNNSSTSVTMNETQVHIVHEMTRSAKNIAVVTNCRERIGARVIHVAHVRYGEK